MKGPVEITNLKTSQSVWTGDASEVVMDYHQRQIVCGKKNWAFGKFALNNVFDTKWEKKTVGKVPKK